MNSLMNLSANFGRYWNGSHSINQDYILLPKAKATIEAQLLVGKIAAHAIGLIAAGFAVSGIFSVVTIIYIPLGIWQLVVSCALATFAHTLFVSARHCNPHRTFADNFYNQEKNGSIFDGTLLAYIPNIHKRLPAFCTKVARHAPIIRDHFVAMGADFRAIGAKSWQIFSEAYKIAT